MSIMSESFAIDWGAAGDEVVTHLQNLLRLDTRNPPGNENRAADYLRATLQREGIECTIVGPQADRATIIARLQGDGSEKPLLLMSHTDVVAVEPDKWSYDPFAATIADGYIYGRGALDMKNMVAMELMTMLLLKRAGVPLKRDVIFMAAADEETGGHEGAKWVVEHYPELIQAEYALNEGGGNGLEVNGQLYYTVQAAEKGTARFRLRTAGTPGHGSIPHDDNAILKLAALIQKANASALPVHFTASARAYIAGIASAQPPDAARLFMDVLTSEATADAAIEKLPALDSFKQELHAQLRNTITPTMLEAGSQINVIPSRAEANFDARILPGWTTEDFLTELRTLFGEEANITFVKPSEPVEADPASPLFQVIREVLEQHAPDASLVPTLLTGGTDAKHVSRLGTKVYGFSPELYMKGSDGWGGIHGHDERIHTSSLQWGLQVLYDVVARFTTS